jgi:DNA-binding NtrC family response regulator
MEPSAGGGRKAPLYQHPAGRVPGDDDATEVELVLPPPDSTYTALVSTTMSSQILITMDDLETAVRLNAAFEAAKLTTAMFSSVDDVRATVRRESPELIILTGAVHDPHAQQLAALAHDAEISTLALLEPTDSERTERVERLHATEVMTKPVAPDDAVATARRLIERRRRGVVAKDEEDGEVLPGAINQPAEARRCEPAATLLSCP